MEDHIAYSQQLIRFAICAIQNIQALLETLLNQPYDRRRQFYSTLHALLFVIWEDLKIPRYPLVNNRRADIFDLLTNLETLCQVRFLIFASSCYIPHIGSAF